MKKILETSDDGEGQWLPISDLMSVLMMIFLLIAISYMIQIYAEKQKIEDIAITYNELQDELYEDLNLEFKEDLNKWNAVLKKETLSIRFKSPEILFDTGSSQLKKNFCEILDSFWPRFVAILNSEKYQEEIEEIRIEGHTSSYWSNLSSEKTAYINNMELSQDRTRNVLQYLLNIDDSRNNVGFVEKNVTANGLSSSKLILNVDGLENRELSRRVEFRVRTNAEQRIAKILSD